MTQSYSYQFWLIGLISFLGTSALITSLKTLTLAQIVPDSTLGAENSVVNSNVNINGIQSDLIEGGAIRNATLFHSFEKFNIDEGKGAYFANPTGIEIILSRVTGNTPSEIMGTLGVLGNADLFLINPNGIIFGSNASLDLQGSFLATTADSVLLSDRDRFSAINPQTPPLLRISVPVGLQFGEIKGQILNLSKPSLAVESGKTLALVGGEIRMPGGNLTAIEGRVELGSVDNNSQVSLEREKNWALGYEGVQNFRDIQLSQEASIHANGEGGGEIDLRGKNITLADGSRIFATVTTGAQAGGTLRVVASDSIKLVGTNLFNDSSGLFTATLSEGNAGNVEIDTGRLLLQDGATISTESSKIEIFPGFVIQATGRGGDINVNTSESVVLEGNNSSLLTQTQGSGDAGNLTIATRQLIVQDGAQISVSSEGTGVAGNINITANSLLMNQASITAETRGSQPQEGANIQLQISDLLLLENESLISSQAFDNSNGGNIDLNTRFLIARTPQGSNGNDIIANADRGNGGRIDITASGIFGIDERQAFSENETNDIDASSRFGLDGEVKINDPNVDPQRALEELPETPVDVSRLVNQNLCKAGTGSEFIITGRGGLPDSPNETLSADAVWEDWRISKESDRAVSSSSPVSSQPIVEDKPQTIVEAQGWVTNTQGQIVLIANPVAFTPYSPGFASSHCQSSLLRRLKS